MVQHKVNGLVNRQLPRERLQPLNNTHVLIRTLHCKPLIKYLDTYKSFPPGNIKR
jgi:hypothetical protein